MEEISLEFNIIACCCTSSFLVANIDFLEPWVPVKEAVNLMSVNGMDGGGGGCRA